MGRNPFEVDKDELKEKLEELGTQTAVAEHYGVANSTISNQVAKHDLGAKIKPKTPHNKRLEYPNYSWEEAKEILLTLEEETEETIGHDRVNIEIETETPVLYIGVADLHIGANYVYSKRLIQCVEDLRDPQIVCSVDGDLADNYNTSAYKGGQIEAKLKIQKQKAIVERILKELTPSALSILNGCHDEWSYYNDGFDLAQFLAHKTNCYYMGHRGNINLKVGEVNYELHVCHNTYRNSTVNPGHGLASVYKEEREFDIGFAAHTHKPHCETRIMRGEQVSLNICGAFKGVDRFASKTGFPPLHGCTPGVLLYPKEKKFVSCIDYTMLKRFL